MHTLTTSALPFPPIAYWAHISGAASIKIDLGEHFEKMSFRNRYLISGSNNPIQLSIPLVNGRDQRATMGTVGICNDTRWQTQHWRSLESVYRQTPFWDFYAPELKPMYEREYNLLADYNIDSLRFMLKYLKLHQPLSIENAYCNGNLSETIDLRKIKPANFGKGMVDFPRYYQVFEDKIGFIPNLSILDLLFSEGPQTIHWLKSRQAVLTGYPIG